MVSIKSVSKVTTGKTPSKKVEEYFGGDIPFISPSELGEEPYVLKAKQTLTVNGAAQIKLVPKNSVLVCCIGSLGKLAIADRELGTNQQINSVTFDETKVFPKFGYYALGRLKPILVSMAPATTVAIVSKSKFEVLEIPLPPLNEQKRIAAILDKADSVRRKRQQAIDLADDFLRSVFLDMFGDPVSNPKGFPIGTIRDFVETANYGSSGKASETEGEYPMLRMGNITYEGGWDFTNLKYIDLSEKDKPKYLTQKGDLLFNRTNSKELVGKTAVFEEEKPMAIAGYLIRVRTNNLGNNYYLSGYLNSAHGKKTLVGMCKSIVGMANINAQELQNIKILIPPIELQNEFENIVKATKQKLKSFNKSNELLNDNFNSLIQKAFAGEL
ncbi:restriction endonuclease [Alteromonadaceae bacterium M269]|nr:restriction endonuclease [Alteromonadaceae bacterium M269]